MARRNAAAHQLPPVAKAQFDYLPFQGGLDLETPPWSAKPGVLRDAMNYEVAVGGGYADIMGYERLDGRPAPSAANYSILTVSISGTVAVADTVTGVTSGATGVVLAVVPAVGPVAAYLVLSKVVGTFDASEDLTVIGVQATTLAMASAGAASTQLLHAQYLNLAADLYRADIAAVPGSGSVLGVWMLADVVYAVRNNAGGTAAVIHKSTGAGWSAVALGRELAFTAGGGGVGTAIEEGDTITGSVSGATAVVTRVMLETGSFSGMDGAGRLIFASQTGTFQAENLLVSAVVLATIAGNSSAITLLPDGSFETDVGNFGGQAVTRRVYGCDGVNRGFEFDGTVFCPIHTGMTLDAPSHVNIHKSQLFFAFESSAQHSGPGFPYKWNPIFGAAELAVEDTITGFKHQPGSQGDAALAIFSQNHIHVLYGNNVSDWNLVAYREEVGARAKTIQDLAYTLFLDDRGLTSLRTAQEFGNFQHSTLSTQIQRFLNARRSAACGSCVVRDKNQYRLFFTDRQALYVTMNGNKVAGIMPQQLEHRVTAITSVEASSGAEMVLFGSTDGMVYQMEKGTSFDGASIEARLAGHFWHGKSFGWEKQYLSATIEAVGGGYAEFNLSYELGYGATDIPQPTGETKVLDYSTVRWDEFVWDEFIWDGTSLGPTRSDLDGQAENISFVIRKSGDYMSPVTMTGVRVRQVLRKQVQ